MPVARMGTDRWLRGVGWASVAANCLLVVTGGAVRLTGSGLGCPTWPRCHGSSFTPHGEMNIHSAIEFGNRTLTFLLAAVAVVTFVAAWQSGRRELRWLAFWMAMAIPAQAVIGGITVLTHLNPWVVSFHLLSSFAIITVAVLFLWRIDRPLPRPSVMGWATFAAAWGVLYIGTVVTGSGPHAGDARAPRNGLSPLQTSQFHADLVFLLVGLTLAMLIAARTRSVVWLLGLEVAQGAVGFVQYFTGLPIVLVGFHMLGAALIAAATAWVLYDSDTRGSGADPGSAPAARREPSGTVSR
ncbi:COX15/CtaA family protein [Nocardioides terrisoli]|uniref:COX15/CtaA family protein n=1 Tax=Nocardioides terrisoli TaxID=3388267 RepID=UPI00287B8CFB|nr:COX15/CtaA family protein [Nocardioides marmorisolisilvae]